MRKKIQKKKILRRKSTGNTKELLHMFFAIQRVHLEISHLWLSIDLQTATHVLYYSTSSFENKPLVTLNWSSKSRKCHHRSSSCDQSERIREKIFFYKEYYFWYCTIIFSILINILTFIWPLFGGILTDFPSFKGLVDLLSIALIFFFHFYQKGK